MTKGELLQIVPVRDYLLDSQRLDDVDEIAQKNGLPLKRADELSRLADAVMFGELEASKMPELIAKAFGVEAGAAQQVATDVIGYRLLPLAEFVPGIEKQLADWGGEAKEYPDVHITRPRYTIEKAILDYAAQVGLELDEPIMKRFVYLAKGYLLKERAKDATVTLMHRPVNIGGLGLTSELAEKVLQHLDDVDLSKVEDLPTHEDDVAEETPEPATKDTAEDAVVKSEEKAEQKQEQSAEDLSTTLKVTEEKEQTAQDDANKDPSSFGMTQDAVSQPNGAALRIANEDASQVVEQTIEQTDDRVIAAKVPVAKVETNVEAGEAEIAKEEKTEDPLPIDTSQVVVSLPNGGELRIASEPSPVDTAEDVVSQPKSAELSITSEVEEVKDDKNEDSSAGLSITEDNKKPKPPEKKPVRKESPKVAPTAAIVPVPTQAMATVVPTIAGELIHPHEQAEVEKHEKKVAAMPKDEFDAKCDDQCRQVVNKLKPMLKGTKVTQRSMSSLVSGVLRGRIDVDRAFVQLSQFGVEAEVAHKAVDVIKAGHTELHTVEKPKGLATPAPEKAEDTTEQDVLDMRHAALTKQMPKESVKPVLPGARVSASRTPAQEVKQQLANVDKQKVKTAQQASRPEPAKVKLSAASVTPPPVKQKKVTDVRFEKKLVGPVEELGTMTLADFRRLSSDPQEAMKKLLDKLALLEETDYEDRIKGVRAWRSSPMSQLYKQMTQEALMSGVSVSEMATQMRAKGEETLTPAEIAAVVSFNAQIAF